MLFDRHDARCVSGWTYTPPPKIDVCARAANSATNLVVCADTVQE